MQNVGLGDRCSVYQPATCCTAMSPPSPTSLSDPTNIPYECPRDCRLRLRVVVVPVEDRCDALLAKEPLVDADETFTVVPARTTAEATVHSRRVDGALIDLGTSPVGQITRRQTSGIGWASSTAGGGGDGHVVGSWPLRSSWARESRAVS